MLALLTYLWLAFMPMAFAPLATLPQAEQAFTPVQGPTLQAKFDAAAAQAGTARQARFWTAYSFDVRPGVAVDVDFVSDDGRFVVQGTWESDGAGSLYISDFAAVTNYPGLETRSLGVFILRDAAGQIERVNVYNLARRHEYAGYPVYWAGRAQNEESLNFLRGVAESGARLGFPGADAVSAISLHDDRRVPETLLHIARNSQVDGVRVRAVRALGTPPVPDAVRDYLAQLARDEHEAAEVRRAAIAAYGRARDAQALSFMQSLYSSLTSRELRRAALTQLARNENQQAAASFLVKVATQEADSELRRMAVARLGEIAGEQALGTLRQTATSNDADTELQKQAVIAISRRPAAESVPLLINIAKTHSKPEVRRQAFVLLGRTNDPAAIEFLKSVLTR